MTLKESDIVNRLRDAVVALKEVRSQRDVLLREKSEPIAIIGMACRFPGNANTPEEFFDFLLSGGDAITAVPPDRWPIDPLIDADPKLQGARWGAFVNNVDLFDPAFFGISPREAERMDPQQRFLLEVTWEALERSGIVPGSIAGTKTGVFVGIMNTDYFLMNLSIPREQHDAYSATGNGHCFPAGRLAYTFGFQGPAVTIDTACSSSLVATHLGCQSLRTADSDVAIVCGVNLMLDPLISELTAKTGALAPDGRCKSFDSRANGYVRGEGCGVVILKRLSAAQRDGNPIIALIRGSAVNQDGRSTGLTTPNVLAQQAMLEQALANAHVQAEDIGYVEAHGTGTPLGDPIEMDALKAVLGKPHPDGTRCLIGTVKTNLGHMEAAAGVAGLIKAALALQRQVIPKILHLRTQNPRISISGSRLAIATESIPWRQTDKPRRAGVSSFGMSGTNAHIVLEEAPQKEAAPPSKAHSAYLLPLSAKTPDALLAAIRSYAKWFLTASDIAIEDVIHTASTGRTQYEHRLAVVARERAEFSRLLGSFADGDGPSGAVQGHARAQSAPKIVFVFPGQGSQWVGMGKELLAEEPAFRAAIEACDHAILREAGFSVLEEIEADEAHSHLGEIDVVQPLLFAIEVALAALWQSWGIIPDCVVGHSMGEVAAAHVAGMLTLDDAVKIICQRSRIMRRLRGKGAMGLVELPLDEVETAIAGLEERLSVAVSNGPRSTVLSGDPGALEAVLETLESKGVFCRRVKVDVASHSPQVDVLQNELLDALRDVKSATGKFRMVSTVTGKPLLAEDLSAEYWWNNLRRPVRFFQVTQELIRNQSVAFIELSPHPILLAALEETLNATPNDSVAIESMLRQAPQRSVMLEALGTLWVHGCRIDWTKSHGDGHIVPLPTYQWQRERYWIEPPETPTKLVVPPEEPLDEWLFQLEWQLAPLAEMSLAPTQSRETWLVFMDSGRIGMNVIARLRSRGYQCIRVDIGSKYEQHSPAQYCINGSDPGDYDRLLGSAFAAGTAIRGIVHLTGLDAPSWDETTVDTLRTGQQHGFLNALYLTQSLMRHGIRKKPRLWLVSHGAIATKPSDVMRSVAQASLWGLGRTIMQEHPELRCTCVDLDGAIKFDTVTAFVRELEADDREEHIALRPTGRFIGRFVRGRMEQAPMVDFALKPDASYLITGGLSGLGLSVAQWMIDKGVRNVALMGRRSPSATTQDAIRNMKAMGANVLVLQGDVSHPDDVLKAICSISAELPELRGIVHAAGILDDRTLLELTAQNVTNVFAPKIEGAWNLHTFTSNQQLDFFVLYSSGASLFGSAGQANYASANAFLDALAQARHARGLPAMSIQWGAFSEIGLAAQRENRGGRLNTRGIASLSPADGIRALEQLLKRPRAQIGVLRLNVGQWVEFSPELTTRALWSNLVAAIEPLQGKPSRPTKARATATSEPQLRDKMANELPAVRVKMLEEHVRTQFARVLRMDSAKIGLHEKIHNYGLDSLMAIELRNRLQASLDMQFSVTEIWAHASVAELSAWLAETFGDNSDGPNEPASARQSPETIPSVGAPGQWIVIGRPSPNPRMRLFCFPYAGGGAPVYSSWAGRLPADIEVGAIQLPGRHARIAEPLLQGITEMVAGIVPALLPHLDRPFAMFGHCLGAIVMYEVVRILYSQHGISPMQLFASAAPSPHQYLVPNVASQPDDEFLGLLRAIGLAQKDVLDDPDVVRTMLPMVRADFAAASKYVHTPYTRLDIPITTFSADADIFAPPTAVNGWRNETTSYFAKHEYAGGHYFLVPERDSILRTVTSDMEYRYAANQQLRSPGVPLQWIRRAESRQKPPLRLFCFPGVGGTAKDFHTLTTVMPRDAELCAIELPGHGTRSTEAPLGRVQDIVVHVMSKLGNHLDRPFVFLGHDLGALVMYEVMLRLRQIGGALPLGLIVVAAAAPSVHYIAPIQHLSDEAFAATLRLFDLSWDPGVVKNALRTDFAALANYESTPAAPLHRPICAISGEKDLFTTPAAVAAWRQHTREQFVQHVLPCNHLGTLSSEQTLAVVRDEILNMIRA